MKGLALLPSTLLCEIGLLTEPRVFIYWLAELPKEYWGSSCLSPSTGTRSKLCQVWLFTIGARVQNLGSQARTASTFPTEPSAHF